MPGQNLTRVEAAERAALVRTGSYDVTLDLTSGEDTFRSTTTARFSATPGASTFIDLIAPAVHEITLNGRRLDPAQVYADSRIALTGLEQDNELTVVADCAYMHTGEGLHRFTDPADGATYLYTQFEVPDSRRVYAVFEQPDLKASFTFTVTTPQEWTVLSNSPTPEPTPAAEGAHTFAFAPTERLSSYVTAVVAGPYTGVTSEYRADDGRVVPLGVYCRASLAEYLDAEEILEMTRKGLAYYEELFGTPYAFAKYDQIFVPEFNAGAMENAGCVTHRDDYVFRSRPVQARVERRAVTVLHELAHMWFGDLVTMKWWNDLWLNESFAEFMSHLALAENTPYTEGWTGFMVRKDWGLKQDQLPTTHPITAQIRDLADVEVNFDGITYAKGASVLRQLVSYVGRDAFFAGLHEYLTAHSYANATLADLLGELEKASGRDLAAWSKVWLEEAGVTLLRPSVETDGEGRITRLSIEQEAFSEGASLRPHRLAVAGYSLDGESLQRVFHEELDVDGASTDVPSAEGVARPDFILVNDGDLAYAKIRLDEDSLAFAVANITRFTDSLTRGVVMAAAWDMTRDGQMKARDYLNLALTAVPAETNMQLLTLTLRHIDEAVRTFVAPDARAEAAETVGRRLLLLARTARSGSDAQRMLVAAAARNASNAEQFEAIKALYDGSATLEGLELDVDLQWSLLIALVRGGVAGDAEIDAREQEDDTMTGRQNAAAARAARDDAAVKEQVWEQVLGDKSIPNDTRWAMVSGFWAQARTTPSLYEPYVERYFAALAQVWEENTFHTAEDLTTLLFPSDLAGYAPGVDVVRAGHEWIDANPGAPAGAVRIIRERIDVCERQMANQVADA